MARILWIWIVSSIRLWNHFIFVPQQSCVNDLVATEAVSGPSTVEAQSIPCNLTMHFFYRPSYPIDENGSKIFNIGTDNLGKQWEASQTLSGPLNITRRRKSTVNTLASFESTKYCAMLSCELPRISSTTTLVAVFRLLSSKCRCSSL